MIYYKEHMEKYSASHHIESVICTVFYWEIFMKAKRNQLVFATLICLAIGHATSAFCQDGGVGGGGGDEFTADFINVASQELYPWLKLHGSSLSPQIDAEDFLAAVNQIVKNKDIASAVRVYESCNGTKKGRQVEACFSTDTGKITLSRSWYPIQKTNSMPKLRLVAHEMFRKMKIEGDQYEVARQISITNSDQTGIHGQAITICGISLPVSSVVPPLRGLSVEDVISGLSIDPDVSLHACSFGRRPVIVYQYPQGQSGAVVFNH